MKNRIIAVLAVAGLLSFPGCKKKTDAGVATVTTTAVTNITDNTVLSGGNVAADGGATVTVKGVCWDTTSAPTISLTTKTTDGSGTGSFISNVNGLIPGKTYYLRAYATNTAGTAYGVAQTFNTTTVSVATVASINTAAVSGITQTSVVCGGTITTDGGKEVVARGVCWGTSPNPTADMATHTTEGTGKGAYTSNITGLAAGTTYFVRAFATNSIGVAYGNEHTFTTTVASTAVMPTLTTTILSGITPIAASSGGVITNNGGAEVTARGICWGTSSSPTVALSTKTTDGAGIGTYTSSMTSLEPNTVYYVRAYATNSAGTAYGIQRSFTTTALAVGVSYGGGLIAYILQAGDPGYSASVKHGLIIATANQSNNKVWGCNGITVGGTSTSLGSGMANTNLVAASSCGAGTAAKLCADLVLGGYSDWYLPSKDELNKVNVSISLLGGFAGWYWTSSEVDGSFAWQQNIGVGSFSSDIKMLTVNVRAMRSF